MEKIQAIDFMYYVATREFMENWDRATEGELVCRMEKAIEGLPRFVSIPAMLGQMDEAGVEKVFMRAVGTQCLEEAHGVPTSSAKSEMLSISLFAEMIRAIAWL